MARLLVISEEELRAVVERAVTEGVNAILRAATTLEADPAELTPATEPSASGVHAHKDGERFQIGSKPGEFSYADVIAQRYDETEFEFERAWSSIKDQVITPSRRARASALRSLDKDRRFARIPDREGIWFRRMDHVSDLPFL